MKESKKWGSNSIRDQLFINLKNNHFEYLNNFIKYEYEILGKNITQILSFTELKNPMKYFEIYKFNQEQLTDIAFDYYNYYSWNLEKSNTALEYLKNSNEKIIFNLIKNRIKEVSIKVKYILFETFIDNIDIYELCFDNLGSSKNLKQLLIGKAQELNKKNIVKILKKKLNSTMIKQRENAVDILIELKIEKSEKIFEERLKIENSKTVTAKIEMFLKNSNNKDKYNKLENYLELLTKKNRELLIPLKEFIIPLNDKNNNNLSVDYSMLLISFYMNYELIKARELTKNIKIFISEKSIIDLAKSIYLGFKSYSYNNKYKEISYFAIVNSNDSTLEDIKKDIIHLATKTTRNLMAANMLKALAYNDDESVLLFLDYVFQKINLKNLKKVAKENLNFILKLKGLSIDELKDTMISNFGFDTYGEKNYSYGSRNFKIKLVNEGKFEIIDIEKKKILKNIPKPCKTDSEETSKNSFEELKKLKKHLKENYELQINRIEKVLSTGRKWNIDNFIKTFIKNPIMREFSINLIWGTYNKNNKLINTFRALEDGSLTTNNEEEFKIKTSCKIRIVHPLELKEEDIEQWKEHLKDHEINQPFSQLNRTIFTEKKDYHLVNLNSTRPKQKLIKLGWELGGSSEFGCFFYFYYKNEAENIIAELKYEKIDIIGNNDNILSKIEVQHLNFYSLDRENDDDFSKNDILIEDKLDFDDIPKYFYSEITYSLYSFLDNEERF